VMVSINSKNVDYRVRSTARFQGMVMGLILFYYLRHKFNPRVPSCPFLTLRLEDRVIGIIGQ